MKKISSIIFALIITIVCCAVLVACSGSDDELGTEDHKHLFGEWVEETPATCELDGVKGHYVCSVCEKYFDRDSVEIASLTIPAGHTYGEWIKSVTVTCSVDGVIGHYTCSVCERNFDAGFNEIGDCTIPSGHIFGEWVEELPRDCVTNGKKGHFRCSRCNGYFDENKNEIEDVTIPAIGKHSFGEYILGNPADCENDGNVGHYHCSECGKDYADSEGKVFIADTVLPSCHDLGTYKEEVPADCVINQGTKAHYHCYRCNRNFDKEMNEIEDITIYPSHTPGQFILGYSETCEKDGMLSHYVCLVCGCLLNDKLTEIITDVIPASHKCDGLISEAPANCYRDGMREHYYCTRCNKYFDAEMQETGKDDLTIPANSVHEYDVNGFCYYCGKAKPDPELAYTLQGNKYYVIGRGEVRAKDEIIVPAEYKGLPVGGIADKAFEHDEKLISVVINSTSEFTIGVKAFDNCTALTEITFGSGLKEIGTNAFGYCSSLAELEFPDSLEKIGANAFESCSGLRKVTLGRGLNEIGSYAFYNCIKLIEVVDNSSLTLTKGGFDNGYVAYYAAYITGEGYEEADAPTFDSDYIIQVDGDERVLLGYTGSASMLDLPIGITKINDSVFSNRTEITRVDLPASLKEIGNNAFSQCTGLEYIEIPDNVTTIGEKAFIGCTHLNSVTLGRSVKFIGSSAFECCYRLFEVYNRSDIALDINSTDYSANGKIVEFALKIYENEYVSQISTDFDGFTVFTDGDRKILADYRGLETHVVIPAYITAINTYAFRDSQVQSIEIPEGVSEIGESAFDYCGELKSIVLPSTVTVIGKCAFRFCNKLEYIVLPASLTTVRNEAFEGCISLTTVYYCGTEEDWQKVVVMGSNNVRLTNANFIFNYIGKPEEQE